LALRFSAYRTFPAPCNTYLLSWLKTSWKSFFIGTPG
jgi:hypothetical protein